MSLRARLRFSIVAFVAIVVVGMSALYLYDFTRLAFEAASARADLIADQVKGYVIERLDADMAERSVRPTTPAEASQLWAQLMRTDPDLPAMLVRTLADADVVVNILISDKSGRVLVASSPYLVGKIAPPTESFHTVLQGNPFLYLWRLQTREEDYSVTRPLAAMGGDEELFQISVVLRSVLLRHALRPAFASLGLAFGASLVVAIFIGSVLPDLILAPLERVSRQIDQIRAGEFSASERREAREFAAVRSKLNLLGQQFRGARQDAIELRTNVEQLLQRMDEGVLMFDSSGKLMMVGEPAERLLGTKRDTILGRTVEEVFPVTTPAGSLIVEAMRRRKTLRDIVTALDGGGSPKLVVSVEMLRQEGGGQELGTLVTLRDAESRRQIGAQLDLSSRMAAISRLTGGVAHEIKNPLNAIALHLEVLRGRLDSPEPDPEIEVIAREIKRLDTVVKTFLNFNRPIEMQAHPMDLADVAQRVVALIAPEAESKGIHVKANMSSPLWINGDLALLQQAILNVIVNAMEAMSNGGSLGVVVSRSDGECLIEITDDGPGIPPELRERIFNLYFTTKQGGSGIGLAMTFRVVQLHSGTIDFISEQGKGTTFRLRFPELAGYRGDAMAVGGRG